MLTNVASQRHFLRVLRYAHRLFGSLFAIFMVLVVVNVFCITPYRVSGYSMMPTYKNGNVVLLNLVSYVRLSPRHNDVVIMEYRGEHRVRLIKRVTGVPGDKKQMLDGTEIIVPPDHYFLEGDNSPESTDSRTFGPVPKEWIQGKVIPSRDQAGG